MYKQFQVAGPFVGVVDSLPAPNKPPNSFEDVLNMFCRKGRLQTRPAFEVWSSPSDGAILRNAVTFEDAYGYLHTLVLTTKTAYAITAGPIWNVLTLPYADLTGTALPFGLVVTQNRVYFANGSRKVSYVDGSTSVTVAGDVQGSALFMGMLANRVVLAYTIEPDLGSSGAIQYPYRIRWCANGDPDDWTSFGSGFSDLIDVPDRITGYTVIGRNGYIFRNNGLSVMFPTGDASAPFAIEPYSNALEGVGSIFPYALATYGNLCVFVSNDDIYRFNGVEMIPIGGNAKKKIFTDLNNASGDQVCGWIRPSIGIGYDLLSYWLSIPGVNVTWIYLFDEGTWQRVTSSAGRITCLSFVATV